MVMNDVSDIDKKVPKDICCPEKTLQNQTRLPLAFNKQLSSRLGSLSHDYFHPGLMVPWIGKAWGLKLPQWIILLEMQSSINHLGHHYLNLISNILYTLSCGHFGADHYLSLRFEIKSDPFIYTGVDFSRYFRKLKHFFEYCKQAVFKRENNDMHVCIVTVLTLQL